MENQSPISAIPPSNQKNLSALPPFADILLYSWNFYRDHAFLIIGISAIPFFLAIPHTMLLELLPPALTGVFILLSSVFVFLARLALFKTVATNGESGDGVAGAYRGGFKFLVPFVWVSALISLAVLGGAALLLIPGILLSMWLSMAVYILFAEEKKGVEALALSWYYVKGYWLQVFARIFFLGLIMLALSIFFEYFND